MKGRSEESREDQGGEPVSITAEPPRPLCKCGRGPWRKGQRNCHVCNREANKKYRLSLLKGGKSIRLSYSWTGSGNGEDSARQRQ